MHHTLTIFFKFKSNKGFTLVEILVVLGLFSAISTLALGSLFNAKAINAKLQDTQAILDNINLSVQTVTRDIRFGTNFYCSISLPTSTPPTVRKNCIINGRGGTVLIFESADAVNALDRVAYYISNGVLYKNEYVVGQPVEVTQMTTRDVFIQTLLFYVDGANTATGINDENNAIDYKQPLITLIISGESLPEGSRKPVTFNLQTNISARELDNQ